MIEGAAPGGFMHIAALVVVIAFVITLMLPKTLHYIVNGIVLIGLGLAHILYEFYYIDIHLQGSPIVRFVILFVVGATAKELIKESLHERKGMRGLTFLVGFILILLAVIPELYHYGAISFNLPECYLLFSFVYIIAGIVAILAPFFLKD
jgi:hypothetical protein